ncbi:hypothetical protein O159_10560 [Leifsonia xyli subsp. cynodontis DSM 46306]|uniref:DUF8094 domain-containing protein n=1 Tax=Leifsonia xyli subsp. cynodontis DSM 46306 TaxID=1389489 RepID=U3PCA5_LEIXC|nr:hypothetical protein [Leifsonia xyli]AGW41163.1 hypothetical protein O159_10560 [Leifsonia xyli subsp. cynodontis DSM 46306]
MRFVFAIVAFVIAAVMIVAGIAQRTLFVPPSQVTATATVSGDARYIVLNSAVLNAHPGQQTLSVSGAKDPASQVVAYGRTPDVEAWLGDQTYVAIGYDTATGRLTTKTVTAAGAERSTPAPTPTGAASGSAASATPGPNPAGSDLWLEESDGPNAQTTRMNLPPGVSVIVAADGTKPAPNTILVTWPVDTSTPWAFPLIIGGLVLLVIGIALYLWALYTHRKSRGPRRKSGPKMPKLPKTPKYKPTSSAASFESSRGRRSNRRSRVVLPAALAGALALGAIGGGGAFADTTDIPTPSATRTAKPVDQLPPAVTEPQLKRILSRISAVAAKADSTVDLPLAKTRFAGPALQLREANYTIRVKKADEPAPSAIPDGPIELALPQATDTWPRTVNAVVRMPAAADGKAQAPIALALVQETPRDNYLVQYAITLEPNVKVPNLAPASIGAAVVPPDSKLLKVRPDQVGAAYGDILLNGASSKWAESFDLADDKLLPQVGQAWKQQETAKLHQEAGNTSSLAWTSQQGKGPVISMATNDSGAIVWVDPEEVQLHRVLEAGAQVIAGPTVAALSGVATSNTAIQSTYGYQLAFSVPAAGSNEKIRLLGFAQGLISAAQVP